MTRNAVRRILPRRPRARSTALLLVISALVLLHAVLLWQRLDDRSITRPEIAIRWIAAAVIAVAALLLRRALSGPRGWVVLWLVVALLHLAGPAGAVLTQAVLTVTPLLLMFVAIAIGLACGDAPFLRDRDSRVTCPTLVVFVRLRRVDPSLCTNGRERIAAHDEEFMMRTLGTILLLVLLTPFAMAQQNATVVEETPATPEPPLASFFAETTVTATG